VLIETFQSGAVVCAGVSVSLAKRATVASASRRVLAPESAVLVTLIARSLIVIATAIVRTVSAELVSV